MADNTSVQKIDLATVLKGEISRLAKKQVRVELEPYKLAAAKSKEQISALRADLAEMQKTVAQMRRQLGKLMPPAKNMVKPDEANSGHRFTSKGFASLRARLDLSCVQMGLLIGASDQSVRKWEEGASTPRKEFQLAIFALRGIGKKEVVARLEALQQQPES